MKKRILSVLLSMVVATTISSAVPMNVQAETTSVKTAVQSANTTYGRVLGYKHIMNRVPVTMF